MAQFPALPIWTDAYVADCSHLTFTEHGVYFCLLVLIWRSPQCRIPDDDAWIARKLRCDADAMRTHVRPVMREFCQSDGNWITQARLLKEWRWCLERSKKNSAAAKARWNKDKGACVRNANGHAIAMPPTHTLPTPKDLSSLRSDSPEVFNLKAERGEEAITPKPAVRHHKLNGHQKDFDAWYAVYPRHVSRGAAERAYVAALNRASVTDLLAGVERYRKTVEGSDPHFIAHPATWLNQDRWLDDPAGIAPASAAPATGPRRPSGSQFGQQQSFTTQDERRAMRYRAACRAYAKGLPWDKDCGLPPPEGDAILMQERAALNGGGIHA